MNLRPKMKRRLLILAGIGLALSALLAVGFFVRARGLSRQTNAALAAGKKAYAAGDYPTALKQFSTYLEKSGVGKAVKTDADAETVLAYGISRENVPVLPPAARNGHLKEAANIFQQLLSFRPNDAKAQKALLDLYLRPEMQQEGYQAEAIRAADAMLAQDPKNAAALNGKVAALARRDPAAALAVAEQLNDANPADVQGQIQSLWLRVRTKVPADKLVARAEALRKAHDGDPRYELVLGETYRALAGSDLGDTAAREGWTKLARQWFQTAATRDPPDAEFVRQLVLALDRTGQFPQSLAALQKASSAKGTAEDPQLQRTLVERLWLNGAYQAVIDRTPAFDPKAPPADAKLAFLRALSIYQLNAPNRAEADAAIKTLADRKSDPAVAAWAAAVTGRFGTPPRDPRGQVELFRAALTADPDNAAAYYFAGEAYASLGENEKAAQMWVAATARAPAWGIPHALIARVRLAQGRSDEAARHAVAAVQRAPQFRSVVAGYVLARYAQLEKSARPAELEELTQQVTQIQQTWPNEPETLPLYVSLLAKTNKRPAAAAALKAAAAADLPPDALLRLDAVAKAEKLADGDALLNKAEEGKGAAPAVALRRAIELLTGGDADQGLATLRQAQKAADGDNDLRWRLAVASYLDAAAYPTAAKEWADVGDANPTNLTVQTAILSAPARFRDRELWKRAIDRTKSLTGDDGMLWQIEKCRYLLAGDDPKGAAEAVALLTDMVRQNPTQSESHRLLGLALLRDNKPAKAADELTTAAAQRPDHVETAIDLIGVLRRVGNPKLAREKMDDLARRSGLSADARRKLAEFYEDDGRPDRAIALLTAPADSTGAATATRPTTLPAGPFDAPGRGMLARLYRRVGRTADAQSLYLRLAADPAAVPADLAAGAEFFGALKDAAAAKALLDRLAQSGLRPGAMDVIRGRYAERYGTEAEAAGHFAAATAAAPGGAEAWRELAGFHLRHARPDDAVAAIDRGLKAVPADAPLLALRDRAATIRSLKRPADVRPLIELVTRDPTDPAGAKMLQLLADMQNGPATPEAAARTAGKMRELADQYPAFLPVQMHVIQYCLAMNRPDDAAAVAARAVETFPFEPEPARLLALAYTAGTKADKWARVIEAADQWRQRAPADPVPAEVAAAGAMLNQSRPQAAAARLAPYAKAPPTTRPAAPGGAEISERDEALYRTYARALIAVGRVADARRLLEPLLPTTTDARLLWLGLAAAHKAEPAAAAWIDVVAPRVPIDSVLERYALADAWSAAGMTFAAPADLAKARDVLRPLVVRADIGADVLDLFARNALELGDFADAVAGWRRAVGAGRKDPGTANNLAYALLVRGDKADLPEARDLAGSAVAAAPGASSFHDTLARVSLRLGDRPAAVRSFRTALEKDADNVEAMIGLADELRRGQTKEEAAEAKTLLARINRAVDAAPRLPTPLRRQLDDLRAALAALGDAGR